MIRCWYQFSCRHCLSLPGLCHLSTGDLTHFCFSRPFQTFRSDYFVLFFRHCGGHGSSYFIFRAVQKSRLDEVRKHIWLKLLRYFGNCHTIALMAGVLDIKNCCLCSDTVRRRLRSCYSSWGPRTCRFCSAAQHSVRTCLRHSRNSPGKIKWRLNSFDRPQLYEGMVYDGIWVNLIFCLVYI